MSETSFHDINIAVIPPALLTPRYVVTKVVINEDGVPTKPPTSVVTKQLHNCWEFAPDKLVTIDAAIAFAIKNKYQFVGYCLAKSAFLCVDLDNCFQPNGELKLWARVFVDTWKDFIFYAERSPGVTHHGVHLWFRCDPKEHAAFSERLAAAQPKAIKKVQKNIGADHEKIELFWSNYVTMTGNVWGEWDGGTLDKSALEKLYASIAGKDEVKSRGNNSVSAYADLSLYDMITKPASDFPDHSSAVRSLLIKSALKNNCDREKMESDLRQSKLFAHHWEGDKWNRLGQAELDEAVKLAQAVPRKDGESSTRSLIVIVDNEAECKALEYIWDPVLPKGKLIHFGGKSSEGKSPVTVDLLARNTSGSAWPDDTPNTWGKKHGILLNIEDSLEDTILPRYYLAGGAKGMLHYIRGIKVTKKDSAHEAMLAFDEDFGQLAAYARKLAATPEGLGMIVVDPATNYCGAKKMNAEEDMRSILTPLAQLAEELGIVVITVGHLNKSESKDPLQRMMGATAFSGVARGVHMFSKDPEALDSAYHHIMSPCRGEMFESFKYHTTVVEQEFGGKKSKVVKVVWDGRSKNTAEDGLEQDGLKNKKDVKRAGEALRQFLQSGKRSAKECLTFMKDGGFDMDKLKSDRVREAAGVRSEQKNRQWWWFLPAYAELFEPPPEREKRSELKKDDPPAY